MTNSQRIIVNTAAQYIRTLINTFLALFSTRFVLAALGQTDFGVYFLVAGVITMFAFLTNASVITTQRYISFYNGQGQQDKIHSIFSNSLLLHIVIGAGLVAIMLALCYPVIYYGLNIPENRLEAASMVYVITSLMFFVSIILAPIRALFIAKENIVYISCIDVLDGLLKLLFAWLLLFASSDRLILYAALMLSIQIINLLALTIFASKKFPEFHFPHFKEWDNSTVRELSTFAGWTLYSSGCIVARNQGIAVVLNLFFGAIINAAYGIATQVSGSVAFVSSSIINAINPQLVKAEGAKNRSLMMRMAEYESKYAFLLLSMVSVPLIFEMETILRWWLGEVPEHAVAFCQITLIAALCDQLSIGLTSAIQAIGNLKTYTLVFYTTKLLTLVAIWACIKLHLSASEALVSYAVVEFVGSLLRLPLLKSIAGLNIATFCKNVFGRIFVPFLVICGTCYATQHFLTSGYRFFVALVGSVLLGGIAAWLTCLDKNEQQFIYSYIHRHD